MGQVVERVSSEHEADIYEVRGVGGSSSSNDRRIQSLRSNIKQDSINGLRCQLPRHEAALCATLALTRRHIYIPHTSYSTFDFVVPSSTFTSALNNDIQPPSHLATAPRTRTRTPQPAHPAPPSLARSLSLPCGANFLCSIQPTRRDPSMSSRQTPNTRSRPYQKLVYLVRPVISFLNILFQGTYALHSTGWHARPSSISLSPRPSPQSFVISSPPATDPYPPLFHRVYSFLTCRTQPHSALETSEQ